VSTVLPVLQPGDQVEIIAPASSFSKDQLIALQALLDSWQLRCLIQDDLFGPDLLCANTDEKRFLHLQKSLFNPETKAVICGRGGYGSMRLISRLQACTPPADVKLFIGMSDITALHLFLQQTWGWPTVHASVNPLHVSTESLQVLQTLLFQPQGYGLPGVIPFNEAAARKQVIQSSITGGNLSLIQASVGTAWQLDGSNKIIFLEEINERAYKIDRMLMHLTEAQLFKQADAIILGDHLGGLEPNGTSLIQPVLQRFAHSMDVPVFQISGLGHGVTNFPLMLGTSTSIDVSLQKLIMQR